MVKPLMVWLLLCMPYLIHAQSSVSGKVTDENNQPLAGAILSVSGSFVETVTDTNGNYTLTSTKEFPWTTQIALNGYVSRTFLIDAAGEYGAISLMRGMAMGSEVNITASRIPENRLESSAAFTSLDRRHLEATPVNGDPSEYLRNIAGVTLIRSGTESANIELRGPVNVLETNTLVLKDHAPLTAVTDKILIASASALSPLDIASVEVVRGTSGALYGPNASSGVIHYITKDPFKYPGLSAMTSAGENNLFTTRVRYADNDGAKWGWKFLANYRQSHDFKIADDELLGNDGFTRVITPQNFETLGGKSWENVANLDDVGLYNWNFEGGFEYRANEKTKLNYTTSLSRARTNITAPLGHLLLGLQRFEQQARLEMGNLFATIYHRHNFANVDKDLVPNNLADHAYTLNYTYGTEGETQLAQAQRAETYIDLAVQYHLEVGSKLRFQIGADMKLSPAFERTNIYGDNNVNNAYNIYGGYITGNYRLGNLIMKAAGRYDYIDAYNQGVFSPQFGMVYNMGKFFGIRANYSRSLVAPSRERTYMDYNFSSVLPWYFPATHIQGVAQQITYNNPVTRFPFGDISGGEMFEVQDIIDAAAANAGVPAPILPGTVDPAITTASYAAPMVGFPTGFPTTLEQAAKMEPTRLGTVNQLELGFHYMFKHKLRVDVDLFHTWRENLQSNGAVVLSAGSQLNLLQIRNWLEQQIPPSADRDALINSLYSVPANPTSNPLFDGVPGFGVVMSDQAQQFNYAYDLGFRTYGNENVNYYGADLSATYYVNPDWSLLVNYSYLSQIAWSASDLGETNPDNTYYLNTSPDRINLGLHYYPHSGLYGSCSLNYQSEYEGRQGDGTFFTGVNSARILVDLQVGYRFHINKIHWDLGVSVNNLLDEKYSHFVNLGQLRRFGALSVKVSL